MVRYLISMFMIFLVFSLTGCFGEDDGTTFIDPSGDSEESEADESPYIPWGEADEDIIEWGEEETEESDEFVAGALDPSCSHFDPSDELRILACKMLNYINQDRTMFPEESGNAGRLVWDEEMYPVALAHSQDMCDRDFFAHVNPDGLDPFDRMDAGGVTYFAAGENIAWTPFPIDSQYRFMAECICDSHGNHRSNCLSPYFTRVGIGIVKCGDPVGGVYYHYITQNYRALTTEQASYEIPYCDEDANISAYWTEPASSVTPDPYFGLQDRDQDGYTTCEGEATARSFENHSAVFFKREF